MIINLKAILSQLVCKNGWTATNKKHLRRSIKLMMKKFDVKVFQTMMEKVSSKSRKIEEEGPLAVI
jgi:hypothetical protein